MAGVSKASLFSEFIGKLIKNTSKNPNFFKIFLHLFIFICINKIFPKKQAFLSIKNLQIFVFFLSQINPLNFKLNSQKIQIKNPKNLIILTKTFRDSNKRIRNS